MPLAADANPMFEGGTFPAAIQNNQTILKPTVGEARTFFSWMAPPSFLPTPLFGQKDNIWRAGQMQDYTGTEIQDSATDAFLIP